MKITTIVMIIMIILSAILIPFTLDFFEEKGPINKKPIVEIAFPNDGDKVTKIVTISGKATDPDGDQTIKQVEILINNTWIIVDGTNPLVSITSPPDNSYFNYTAFSIQVSHTENNPDILLLAL